MHGLNYALLYHIRRDNSRSQGSLVGERGTTAVCAAVYGWSGRCIVSAVKSAEIR